MTIESLVQRWEERNKREQLTKANAPATLKQKIYFVLALMASLAYFLLIGKDIASYAQIMHLNSR
jgi:hypothetical protein